jgi:hypothetical protein
MPTKKKSTCLVCRKEIKRGRYCRKCFECKNNRWRNGYVRNYDLRHGTLADHEEEKANTEHPPSAINEVAENLQLLTETDY